MNSTYELVRFLQEYREMLDESIESDDVTTSEIAAYFSMCNLLDHLIRQLSLYSIVSFGNAIARQMM